MIRIRLIPLFVAAIIVGAASLGTLSGAGSAARSAHAKLASSSSYCRFSHLVSHTRRNVLGVNVPDQAISGSGLPDCTLGQMAHEHLGFLRDDMQWAGVEGKPGVFDWSFYDAVITELAIHHISFLPILDDAPQFRTAAAGQSHPLPGWYPPSHPADFAHFASLAVMRYGPGGTFWQNNPQLPYYPVRAWQIWNEESLTFFWEPSPNAADYVRLLQAAYGAIKAVDPAATVVTGGVPWNGGDGPGYITQMYADGARSYFDALALHDYGPKPSDVFARMVAARQLMRQAGDGRKPLWITEFGWATGGPPFPYNVGGKASRYDKQVLSYVRRNRRKLHLGSLFYFNWIDAMPSAPGQDYWGNHMGIFRLNLSPKPVARVIRAAAAKLNL
jgi:polysaccharide biosynthesis protein PslG